ncbi:hypothetical protein Tco_0263517, partial [Tanacetum coccineum]
SDVGDTVTMWVEPHYYVLEVKQTINLLFPEMFPDVDAALIFDGTQLGDYQMLRDYPIYGGMTLLFTEAI